MGKRLSLAADCSREDIEAAGVAPAVAATTAGILPQGRTPTAKLFGFKMVLNLLLLQQILHRFIVQSSAKRQAPGSVNFAHALAYLFCLALPAAFTQPGDHLLAEPCI